MKKTLVRLLCLVLCLLLPASALAEKQPWLTPFQNYQVKEGERGSIVFTLLLDGDGIMQLVEFAMEQTLQQTESLYRSLGLTDEEGLEDLQKSVRAENENARKMAAAYVPAISALANHAELTGEYQGTEIHYQLRVDGKDWFGFCMLPQEDGSMLLTSDLFPSYAVKTDVRQITEETGIDLGEDEDPAYRELISTVTSGLMNGEYNDFDLLGSLLDAFQQGLNRLADEGEARREGDTIIYEFTASARGDQQPPHSKISELLKSGELDLEPRMKKLLEATITALESQDEGEPQEEEELDFGKLADRIGSAFTNATRTNSVALRYELTGDELRYTLTHTTESGLTLPNTDESSMLGQLMQKAAGEKTKEETVTSWKLTPTSFETNRQEEDATEKLTLSVGENEIQAHFQQGYAGAQEMMAALQAVRNENGQEWDIVIAEPIYSYRVVNGETIRDYLDDPLEIHLNFILDNEGKGMEAAMYTSLSGENALFSMKSEKGPAGEEAFEPVDLSGLKKAENEAGFWKEIRTVTAPKLNKLILTGLPADARPLMTPLLGLVGELVNYAKNQE
ncbi:MAG: hypothetical protein Q4G00_15555 [Clostridia bacterium]|nr:hypothetical protein [Clostridia bacterium]